jgi:hypothetical protein
MGNELAKLTVFPTRMGAEMAKQLLEAAGIPSFVSADDAGGMRPAPFAYTCGAELIVNKKDFQKAREILNLL